VKKFLKFIFKNLDQKVGNLFDYAKLAQVSESFSGAEIRQSIIEGMYHAFYEKREFTTDDICLH
jgi:ATP-dependent 26S proteasome regulatory subunit